VIQFKFVWPNLGQMAVIRRLLRLPDQSELFAQPSRHPTLRSTGALSSRPP